MDHRGVLFRVLFFFFRTLVHFVVILLKLPRIDCHVIQSDLLIPYIVGGQLTFQMVT